MYTLYFANPQPLTGMWEVVSEQYESIDSPTPIEGATVVSGNLTRDEATRMAASKQRASYSDNRRTHAQT